MSDVASSRTLCCRKILLQRRKCRILRYFFPLSLVSCSLSLFRRQAKPLFSRFLFNLLLVIAIFEIKQFMATRGCNMTMFDMFFVSAILTMTICMATWNGYAKCETVYKWMEADFTAAILFRILLTVELRLASGIGLDLFGEHVHYCARAVVLSAIYMIFYPFLWAWNTIGFVWWFTSSEKDWLPGSGLGCCYFIFLLICFYELFRFASSSVEKHIAAQRPLTPILRADKGIPISKNKVHDLLADSEHASIHHSG